MGPSLPPFRGPSRGYWVGGIFVLILFLVGGLAFWKGTWAVDKLEELAGFPPNHPTKVLKESNLLDLANEAAPIPVLPEAVNREGTKGLDGQEKTVVAKISENGATVFKSTPMNGAPVRLGVEKKRDEDLLVKSAEKKEKAPTTIGVGVESGVAEVPMGGLKPMKVELDEAGLVLDKPEEREKKRVDGVEAFLRSLHVQGVRLQGKDSRILVDGVPIGLGEKVGSMGLVLESVEPQKLIFSDSGGKKYPKSY